VANNKNQAAMVTLYVVTADLEEEGRVVTAYASENEANICAAAAVEGTVEEFYDADIEVTSDNWRAALDELHNRYGIGDRVHVDPVKVPLPDTSLLDLTTAEHAAVLAGLRLLEAHLMNGDSESLGEVADILDGCGTIQPIDGQDIDGLCQRINVREAA